MQPTALVTGGFGGIGRAISEALRDHGHRVIATTRDPAAVASLDGVEAEALDVADPVSVDALLGRIDPPDVLVNNAGIQIGGPVESLDATHLERLLAVNVVGPLRLIGGIAPAMRQRGSGHIVNISSVAGRIGQPLQGGYAASKHALEALTEALYFELGHFGVRVSLIQPGFVGEGMTVLDGAATPADYAELETQLAGLDDAVTGGTRTPPGAVAEIVIAAITAEDHHLRWRAGPDAELILGARADLGDDEFEAAMRQLLNLTW